MAIQSVIKEGLCFTHPLFHDTYMVTRVSPSGKTVDVKMVGACVPHVVGYVPRVGTVYKNKRVVYITDGPFRGNYRIKIDQDYIYA